MGCWCRAQTHSTGLSPPVCVCSISARAAVLHTPPGSFGSVPVERLTAGCFPFASAGAQNAGPLWASRSSPFDLQHAADPSDVKLNISTIRRFAVAESSSQLLITSAVKSARLKSLRLLSLSSRWHISSHKQLSRPISGLPSTHLTRRSCTTMTSPTTIASRFFKLKLLAFTRISVPSVWRSRALSFKMLLSTPTSFWRAAC